MSVLIFTLYLLAGVPSAPAAELEDAFGDRASQATTLLITAVVGADSAEILASPGFFCVEIPEKDVSFNSIPSVCFLRNKGRRRSLEELGR